jgi:hypothetical protein
MSATTATNGVHHATDEAIDLLYSWMPGLSPAPQPLPFCSRFLKNDGTTAYKR